MTEDHLSNLSPDFEPTNLEARILETEKSVLRADQGHIFQTVEQATAKHPEIGNFISQKMRAALEDAPNEQKLITNTALVVYYLTQTLHFDIPPMEKSELADDIGHTLQAAIAVNEDDLSLRKQDKNSIYENLQQDMKEYPELAAYVAGKMRESVSLEEANLIGETALVVYNSMKDEMTLPVLLAASNQN